MRWLLLVLWGALAVALLAVGLQRPPGNWELPDLEVHPSLTETAVAFEVGREAARAGRAYGPRDEGRGAARKTDIAVVNLQTGAAERVPQGLAGQLPDGSSYQPQLSADGQRLAFVSEASNLVPDDRNSVADTFVLDRGTGQLTRLVPPQERFGECTSFWPSISPAGSRVAYSTFGVEGGARRLVLWGEGTSQVCPQNLSVYGRLAFSPDGGRGAAAFFTEGDPPSLHIDLFELRPGPWSTPLRLTEGADGPSHAPVLSQRHCFFATLASNLVPRGESEVYHIVGCDLEAGGFELISAGAKDDCLEPTTSSDGRWVAYTSFAPDAEAAIVLKDRETGRLRKLAAGYNPCLAPDGSGLSFVHGGQVYLWKRETDAIQRLAF